MGREGDGCRWRGGGRGSEYEWSGKGKGRKGGWLLWVEREAEEGYVDGGVSLVELKREEDDEIS